MTARPDLAEIERLLKAVPDAEWNITKAPGYLRALLARVRELEAALEWRPIETAPRDRTAVWLLCGGRRYIGYHEPAAPPIWPEGKWYLKATVRQRPAESLPEEILGCYAHDANPTAWLPLPATPAKEKGETDG